MLTNPILKSFKSLNVYLICWLLIAILYFLLLYFGSEQGLNIAVTESLTFTIILTGIGLSLWYPARYISIENTKLSRVLFSHLFAALITTIIWLLIGYFIMTGIFSFGDNYEAFFYSTIPWRILIGIMYYALITSFYYMIIYYTGFQERIIKESELKNLVTQAELKTLKFQINPHFIFNSLNSMSALTEIDPAKAKRMILKLADFLRYILATNERQQSKLSEELKNIRLYLEIEKVRFEDKFEYVEEIGDACTQAEIPSMILQPLFENAIKHAVYETLDKVILKLSCCLENSYLKIEIENNFDESALPRKGAGVGLKNINDRLQLIYHRDDLMKVVKEKGIFKVTLFIPVEEN
jgi:two-component system, LytTR family, sensor kinase